MQVGWVAAEAVAETLARGILPGDELRLESSEKKGEEEEVWLVVVGFIWAHKSGRLAR